MRKFIPFDYNVYCTEGKFIEQRWRLNTVRAERVALVFFEEDFDHVGIEELILGQALALHEDERIFSHAAEAHESTVPHSTSVGMFVSRSCGSFRKELFESFQLEVQSVLHTSYHIAQIFSSPGSIAHRTLDVHSVGWQQRGHCLAHWLLNGVTVRTPDRKRTSHWFLADRSAIGGSLPTASLFVFRPVKENKNTFVVFDCF